MWPTRYSMVFWGHPPYKAETVLPEVICSMDQAIGQSLSWHLEGRPDYPIPGLLGQWRAFTLERRSREDNSLNLCLDSPCGLSISLNLDAPHYVRDFDVLTIDLATKYLIGPQAAFSFDRLYTLFVQNIKLFQPFWATVWDGDLIVTDEFQALRLSSDTTKVPIAVHWMNFFGEGMSARLGGRDKLLSAPAYHVEELSNPLGVSLVLQYETFDRTFPLT